MAQIFFVSEAAHELCDTAGLTQSQKMFAYQANEAGSYTDLATDFLWLNVDVDMPFTLTELQAKADELLAAEPLRLLRHLRTKLLEETDWMAVGDRTMSQAEIDYRQALRDLPANSPSVGFVDYANGDVTLTGVTWPTKP